VKRGLGPLLLMVGLLFGPGYFIVTAYLSGEPGQTFTLTERSARWTLPDGTILHFAHGSAYKPVAIDLDPNMNRIAFELSFQFAPAQAGATAAATEDYEAVLYQADQAILQRALRVDAKSAGTRKIDAGSIDVYYPGTYTFILEGPEPVHVPVSQVTLQVRQKIETPSMPFLVVGMVVLVVGLALSLEPYLPGRRRR
jgi:hypothetical protein